MRKTQLSVRHIFLIKSTNNFQFLFYNRSPRKGCTILCLWCVFGPLPHPLRPGSTDLLSHRLPAPPAASRQETTASSRLILRFQRLGLRLGHHLRSVGAETPALWAYAQHERVHVSGGAGKSTEAWGKGANHPGDLDERTAGHPRDTEPQSVLLRTAEGRLIGGLLDSNKNLEHTWVGVERDKALMKLYKHECKSSWTLTDEKSGRYCRLLKKVLLLCWFAYSSGYHKLFPFWVKQ